MDALPLVRRPDARLGAFVTTRAGTLSLLGALVALSLVLRTRAIGAGFWIDEGLSVGISSHHLTAIPHLLREDGSPPLYYLLLHGWMAAFGSSEAQTHALSLVFALLTIPAAFWAVDGVFGRRAGWIAAGLAALDPFLTAYAQETRMYTLVALLSIVAAGAFVHAFVFRRRAYLPAFAATLVVLLYTHNWGLFFAGGALAALGYLLTQSDDRRGLALDGALAFGAVALLFAPWVPTLGYQVAHTGAPWSTPPSPAQLLGGPAFIAAGDGAAMALILAGGTGIAALLRRERGRERTAVVATIVLVVATVLFAWIASQISPAWANRYLAVVLGPFVLFLAAGLVRGGRLAVVALALVAVFWLAYQAPDEKSNVEKVAAKVAPRLEPGDLVISTHPEQIPVLHYYLPPGLRYANEMGPVADPTVMDWRDAVARLRATRPQTDLEPLLDRLPVGGRILFIRPIFDRRGWQAPWTSLVRIRSGQWARALRTDNRFVGSANLRGSKESFKGVVARLFTKVRSH